MIVTHLRSIKITQEGDGRKGIMRFSQSSEISDISFKHNYADIFSFVRD